MKAGVGFRRQYAELGGKKKPGRLYFRLYWSSSYEAQPEAGYQRWSWGVGGCSKIQLSVGDPEEMKVTFYFSNYVQLNNLLMFSVILFFFQINYHSY